MLLVIASDMVKNRMPMLGLMKCIASDYAESHSQQKVGTCKQTLADTH